MSNRQAGEVATSRGSMGIPHLTATLEPFATLRIIQGDSIVIDGPALAYHILRLCRAHGIQQPSYRLLADFALRWLDELSCRVNEVQAIYFDGYLPVAKRQTRFKRLYHSTSAISQHWTKNPLRCSRDEVIPASEDLEIGDLDLFITRSIDRKSFADPPFLVPAIIDALRESSSWSSRTWVIPGEADVYCAENVSRHGGLVLTSDSDLLVHDLNQSEVIFFKDLQRRPSSLEIYGLSYSPKRICQRLDLPSSTSLCRMAYELTQNRYATIGMLKAACSQVLSHESNFAAFCKPYLMNRNLDTFLSDKELPGRIRILDPRLSEFAVQLNDLSKTSELQADALCISLPVLIEDPSLPNAWSGSASVRRIAYSVMHQKLSAKKRVGVGIKEYARVQSLPPKGRALEILPLSQMENSIHKILTLARQVQEVSGNQQTLFWPLFCVALDERECQAHGRESHAWRMLKKKPKQSLVMAIDIPWSFIHFAAQLQATCYSLRLLHQALKTDAIDSLPGGSSIMEKMRVFLQGLPCLEDFPTVSVVMQLNKAIRETRLLSSIIDLLDGESVTKSSNCGDTRPLERAKVSVEKPTRPKASEGSSIMRNIFSVLSEGSLND